MTGCINVVLIDATQKCFVRHAKSQKETLIDRYSKSTEANQWRKCKQENEFNETTSV